MEKLQPLITHRFWVCFGLAILVPFIGWWLAQGSADEKIAERNDAIRKAESDAKKGNDVPNEKWIGLAKGINEGHEDAFKRAAIGLWQKQQDDVAMFWPPVTGKVMNKMPYRAGTEEPNAPAGPTGPEALTANTAYPREYGEQFKNKVLAQVKPYADGKGLMEVDTKMVHHLAFNDREVTDWIGRPPTWKEMWDAQEDQWLVHELLKSLADVNSGARTIAEAPIRQLLSLQLVGGNLDIDKKKKKKSGRGLAGGSMVGPSAASGSMAGGGGANASLGGAMGGVASGGGASALEYLKGKPVDGVLSTPEKEFGSDADTSKKAKTPRIGTSFSQTQSSASDTKRRYVNQDEKMPFRTRGFTMKVTIDTDKLPSLLAELTNSRWPVEIMRVHWEASNQGGRKLAAIGTSGEKVGGSANSGGAFGSGGGPSSFGGGAGGSQSFSGEDNSDKYDQEYDPYGGSSGSSFGGSSAKKEEKPKDPAQAAMLDKNLGTVVIAGLITLFNTPAEEELKKLEEQSASADGGTPAKPADAPEPDAAVTAGSDTKTDDTAKTGDDTPAGDGEQQPDGGAAPPPAGGDPEGSGGAVP